MWDAVSVQAPHTARTLLGRLAVHLRQNRAADRLVGQLLMQHARELCDHLVAHREAAEPGEASHIRRVAVTSLGVLRQTLHAAWACDLLAFPEAQTCETACRRLQDALGLLRHRGCVAPPEPDAAARGPISSTMEGLSR